MKLLISGYANKQWPLLIRLDGAIWKFGVGMTSTMTSTTDDTSHLVCQNVKSSDNVLGSCFDNPQISPQARQNNSI